ncbi:MerR family transcriptional regulator [Candidatus Solirubrobacter pratensis]|uniref:MerR family transcriptional regulator n=1 Tax=Candidatus Solirubrobacter pratensis TaxID=1298857 RepID=UPI000420D600|nr:MerR family transcriptional regulator [Candidatus Solirubrobacter pratensis]
MSAPVESRPLRIGELARLAGTTPRTVRYYEELGLLAAEKERGAGEHRTYGEDTLARLRELLRLKSLLGLSLDELREVMAGEDARTARRHAWAVTDDPDERRRMLADATAHVESLLEHVRRHKRDVEEYEAELLVRRDRLKEVAP